MSDNSCIFEFACEYFKRVHLEPRLQHEYYLGMASTHEPTKERCLNYVLSVSRIMERIQTNVQTDLVACENEFARRFVEDARDGKEFRTEMITKGLCELSGMPGPLARVFLSNEKSYDVRVEYVGLLLVPAFEYVQFYARCRDFPFNSASEMEYVFEQDERGFKTLTSLKR